MKETKPTPKDMLKAPLQINIKLASDYPLGEWGLPKMETKGAACFDIRALVPEEDAPKVVRINDPQTFRTGLFFEIPEGYAMFTHSRSGHGFKNAMRLGNCTGIIDSDYRGELLISLHMDTNTKNTQLEIKHGMRIAQALILPIPQIEFILKTQLSETERGEGGGGSTGHF